MYSNTCGHPTLFELRACLTSLHHRLWEGRRSLGVVEATTLRSPSFRRQAESREIYLGHLKMKFGIIYDARGAWMVPVSESKQQDWLNP
jgi:hypothetical protein